MQFKIKVEDEIIDFIYIETDSETNLPVDDASTEMFDILSSSPSIIEITSFLYNPEKDSVWNGTDFIDSENREARPLAKKDDGFKKFAVVLDNKYKFFYGIPDTPENGLKIAALSSNPEIIGE
jgi:hypothetical protein